MSPLYQLVHCTIWLSCCFIMVLFTGGYHWLVSCCSPVTVTLFSPCAIMFSAHNHVHQSETGRCGFSSLTSPSSSYSSTLTADHLFPTPCPLLPCCAHILITSSQHSITLHWLPWEQHYTPPLNFSAYVICTYSVGV